MAVINAGELNRQVVFKLPTSTRNSEGSKENAYAALPAVKAKIEQTNQQRALEVAPVLVGTDKIYVRYSSLTKDVTKDWLVNYDSKDHVIHTIEFEGLQNKQFIKLIVKSNG